MVFVEAYDCNVEVICKGQPLSEHVDESTADDPFGITRYVQSEAGELFEVVVTIGSGFVPLADHLSVFCYVDGIYLEGITHDQTRLHRMLALGGRAQSDRLVFRRMQISTTTAAPIKFAKLNIDTEKPAGKDASQKVKELGTIKVVLEHARNKGVFDGEVSIQGIQSTALSEKALKGQAISQRVSTGQPEARSSRMRLVRSERVGRPFEVKFHYRSQADLCALCIIEPPAQPLQDEAGQVIDSMSKAEARIRDLEAKLNSVQANVKRERADSATDSAPRKKPTVMYEIPDDDDEPVKEVPLPSGLQRLTAKAERIL